jgi:hypothetical protein
MGNHKDTSPPPGAGLRQQLFPLGSIVTTPGALELFSQGVDLHQLLIRHWSGDWGDLSAHDKKENDLSVKEGFRILSSYDTEGGKIWIITEADRSVTTFLLPSEY